MSIQALTQKEARRERPGPVRAGRAVPHPSGSVDLLDETIAFMRLLWALDHGMRKVSKEMRVNLGVTGPERLILRMIGLYTRLSPRDLSRLLHLHPSSLTPALELLVRRGLLARRTDPRDGRRAILELTVAGRRIDRLRAGTIEARVRRALASARRPEVAVASKVLAALADEFERGS